MLWLSNFSRLLPESRKVPRQSRHFTLYAGYGSAPKNWRHGFGLSRARFGDSDCGGASFYKCRPPRWLMAARSPLVVGLGKAVQVEVAHGEVHAVGVAVSLD